MTKNTDMEGNYEIGCYTMMPFKNIFCVQRKNLKELGINRNSSSLSVLDSGDFHCLILLICFFHDDHILLLC